MDLITTPKKNKIFININQKHLVKQWEARLEAYGIYKEYGIYNMIKYKLNKKEYYPKN